MSHALAFLLGAPAVWLGLRHNTRMIRRRWQSDEAHATYTRSGAGASQRASAGLIGLLAGYLLGRRRRS